MSMANIAITGIKNLNEYNIYFADAVGLSKCSSTMDTKFTISRYENVSFSESELLLN